ncbi:MAG: hypothetical protein JW896_04410 [Deltaproteobacteria bacterium]|nr:hypothetical protein [Deltaproteobacteria bacterium]
MKTSFIIALSIFAVSFSGQAATLSLESCAAIEDPAERLACYDTLAGRLPAATAKASGTALSAVDPVAPKADVMDPAAPSVMPTVPGVEPTPYAEAIFGLEHKQKSEEEPPDELRLKWTKKEKDFYGKWVIILENGQVWRQTDSTRFSFKNSEQRVIISRGLFDSFFLGEPEGYRRIRVKRVK